MQRKAIILDMDNTIYPVHAISHKFEMLYNLIEQRYPNKADLPGIKAALMKKPFQVVADEYGFSDELKSECLSILQELTVDEQIQTFEDYNEIKKINLPKYLVTSGFPKLQLSKVKQLGIADDFAEIFIVDLSKPGASKKAIFEKIMMLNNYSAKDLIVVGDDLNSEIKAAQELGIDAILYDPKGTYSPLPSSSLKAIRHFKELHNALS